MISKLLDYCTEHSMTIARFQGHLNMARLNSSERSIVVRWDNINHVWIEDEFLNQAVIYNNISGLWEKL